MTDCKTGRIVVCRPSCFWRASFLKMLETVYVVLKIFLHEFWVNFSLKRKETLLTSLTKTRNGNSWLLTDVFNSRRNCLRAFEKTGFVTVAEHLWDLVVYFIHSTNKRQLKVSHKWGKYIYTILNTLSCAPRRGIEILCFWLKFLNILRSFSF
jgi:hypothetical protein